MRCGRERRTLLAGLRRLGIGRILLATGRPSRTSPRPSTAGSGLDGVRADLTPDQKVLLVLTERKNGPVMMVGDGVNDAPALAAADIGVAMGARGAAASAEAADIVLLVDQLRPPAAGARGRPAAHDASRSKASLPGSACRSPAWSPPRSATCTPVQGALLQEVIDVAVILNALRALR